MYGSAPNNLGLFDLYLPEHMSYLYLPVRMANTGRDIRLPDNLRCLRNVLQGLIELYSDPDDYVYVTAKRGYGPMSRPGWHSDGFGTADLNFLWSRGGFPTQFAIGDFDEVPEGHAEAMAHFSEYANRSNKTSLVHYPDTSLLLLTEKVIHRAPGTADGPRQFVKFTFSKKKFNLEGNSHNYRFDYDWKMYDRAEVRNMEHREELDYVDPRMLP